MTAKLKSVLRRQGFTLIELLLAIAILAILVNMAIPLYNDHVKEAQLGVAKANAQSLRIFIEDYHLTNGSYAVGSDPPYTYNQADLATYFGWRPDGDNGLYDYTVTASADNWSITVKHVASGNWMRCEERLATCCDIDTASATESACP